MPPIVTDGTGYNPTMGATYGQMATYLASRSGLDYHVALNWLRAEGSQQQGNPLGVGYTKAAGPKYFASWRQGLDEVAAWLRGLPQYSGIENAIATRSPAAERAAIIASPWAPGHYGGGARFSTAGISGAVPMSGGAANQIGSSGRQQDPAIAYAPGPGGGPGSPNIPEGKILTPADVTTAVAWARSIGGGDPFGLANWQAGNVVHNDLQPFLGKPWNKATRDAVQAALLKSASEANVDPVGGVAGAISAIPGAIVGAVTPIVVGLAVLATVGVLGWSGAKDVLGS